LRVSASWQAVLARFAYFQREAGYTRTGSHNTRETGQWHEADLVRAPLTARALA
jgi:hypothetical protein